MAAITKIFGVKIILNDNADPVTDSSAIGLYNITSDLSGNAASGQKDVAVDDGTIFAAGDVVTVKDDNASESAIIASIATNTLTMQSNLANAYTTAANALVNGNSVFRWVQNTVGGLTTWVGGIIVDKGIKAWTKTIDLKRGGNIAQAGACKVVVNNTAKFWNTLKTKSIYFNGLRCEIYEVQHTYSGGGANQITLVRRWSGICQKPKWDTKQYGIPMVGYHNKRIANITKKINLKDYPNATGDLLDTPLPAAFGEVYPRFDANNNLIYNGYYKFIRTANKEEPFTIISGTNSLTDTISMFADYPPSGLGTGFQHFPVVGSEGTANRLKYSIQLANLITWYNSGTPQASGTLDVTDFFIDKYIDIIEGTGSDKKRSIEQAIVDIDTDSAIVDITVKDYFEDVLAGNATATADEQTWVRFSKIYRDYTVDTWPCKNFLDENGAAVTAGLNLFSFTNTKKAKVTTENTDAVVEEKPLQFFRLPQYAYEDSGSGNKNDISIDIKLFDGTPDQMNSFLIVPTKDPEFITGTGEVADFGISGVWFLETEGVFKFPNNSVDVTLTPAEPAFFNNMSDKSHTTSGRLLTAGQASTTALLFAMKFQIPDYPKQFSHDDVYIGIKSNFEETDGSGSQHDLEFDIKSLRFLGDAVGIVDLTVATRYGYLNPDVEDIYDNYFTSGFDSNNLGFYYNHPSEYTGYENFKIPNIETIEKYKSLQRIGLFCEIPAHAQPNDFDINIYQLAIMFRKSISIEDAIYSPFQGRIFNDTWGGRFTSADLMTSPRNIMEHLDRLKNWEDTSPPPSEGWGKGYADGALIKTGATTIEGDYDYAGPEFTILDTYKASTQIQEYDRCYIDKIQTSICRDFFCASYYDQDGYANFKRIVKSETTPSDAITLADIVDRSKIIITDPKPSDIFPEPFVQYRKNFATGKYESIIRVTHADAATYSSDYVEGISDSSAEELWDRCNALWKKTRHLEKPPSDMTNKTWFNSDDADSLAQDYIFNWVDWMFNPMVRFPVHYNVAGSWNEAHRFTLQLPHQTSDATIECLTTGIQVDPNPPYHVIVTAIMFSETIPEDFNLKDTYETVSLDWKDQHTALGDENDKKDNT